MLGTHALTTVAFVKSLIAWQRAMVAAVGGPTPTALFSMVDLEKEAVDAATAREWIRFLERVVVGNERLLAEAPTELVRANRRLLLSEVREAIECAKEHVALLGSLPS